MQHLPAFYHRSTIITVDDDTLVSDALRSLFEKNYHVASFDQSRKFIDFVITYKSHTTDYITPYEYTDHEYSDTATHLLVNFSIPRLHNLLSDPGRVDDISIIIIDYNMPEINGLELCEQLRHHPAKKILLTGEADHQTAINAFNNKLIDQFIRKDSPTVADDIVKCVESLTYQYFQSKSLHILTHLETNKPSPLSDPSFANFFNSWIQTKNIKEYALIDKNGSFCMKDNDDNQAYLIIHTDHSLNAFVNAIDDETGVSQILKAVTNRELIPFFGVGNDYWSIESSKWDSCMYEAKLHVGGENYYWAYIE